MSEDTLKPTHYINSDHPDIQEFAQDHAGTGDDVSKAVNLYYAVRDAVPYNIYAFALDEPNFVASNVLKSENAFCVPKAIALAAVTRAAGIPSKVGFADVRNHITTPRVTELMGNDIFRWHAYTALYLDGNWVKATPAFDLELCRRHEMMPLDFNGRDDSIFHPHDTKGRRHMEYLAFHGEFADMPFETFAGEMRASYARMLEAFAKDRAERRMSKH